MADKEQSPEPLPKPKSKPSTRYRRRHRQELNWDFPKLEFKNLSTPQLTASRAIGVLLFYATYLRYFSNVSRAPSGNFVLPPITRGGGGGDVDVGSEIFSKKFLVEFYLALLVGVLYLWPFWNAYRKGSTFNSFVRSCASSWSVSLVIYLSFLKLIQHYGLS
ncbi:hypothetical protein FHL15_004576 [Xylaria flabelliformis]|uniref:Uncharacterized protein n=1 Tax=Xylaria flabelliformis TaxID=2512241 RepID=A0A553I2K3_9PEZI|nr:hypothetical protein FHL15_004576 [Xylaria flabelliformis]